MVLDNVSVEIYWNCIQQQGSTFFYPLLYYWHIEFGWCNESPDGDLDLSQRPNNANSENHPKTDNRLTIPYKRTGGNHESSGLLPTQRTRIY